MLASNSIQSVSVVVVLKFPSNTVNSDGWRDTVATVHVCVCVHAHPCVCFYVFVSE